MRTYIVRQPIMDDEQQVLGYEILYNGDAMESSENAEENLSNTVEGFLMQANSEAFLSDGKAFFTFSPNLLMRKIPELFLRSRLVIQIDEQTLLNSQAKQMVSQYHADGYEVAIYDFVFASRHFNTLDFVDYIKLNFSAYTKDKEKYDNIIYLAKEFGKKIIAYRVETPQDLELAKQLGVDYFQGSVVGKQAKVKAKDYNYLQSNFFLLLIEVTKEEPELSVVEEIISRDVTLTYSLLKLVNSAYFALRSKVQSIRQALGILGVGQLKQWIYLLTFKNGNVEISNELIRTSFLRGTFCEVLVPYAKGVDILPAEAYLMGMFSTLDVLMDAPLEQVLAELPISDAVRRALINREGTCGILFDLVLSYEQANWAKMTELSDKLQIPLNIITQKYFECVESVNEIWRELTGNR